MEFNSGFKGLNACGVARTFASMGLYRRLAGQICQKFSLNKYLTQEWNNMYSDILATWQHRAYIKQFLLLLFF
jgi:hypothetical protein